MRGWNLLFVGGVFLYTSRDLHVTRRMLVEVMSKKKNSAPFLFFWFFSLVKNLPPHPPCLFVFDFPLFNISLWSVSVCFLFSVPLIFLIFCVCVTNKTERKRNNEIFFKHMPLTRVVRCFISLSLRGKKNT